MADFFAVRSSQSRAKHTILERYSGAWANIIGNGYINIQRRTSSALSLDLVYIDGFAGAGRYGRDADVPQGSETAPVWGSPIIGMRALERTASELRKRGLRVRVTGLACEKATSDHSRLLENLHVSRLETPVDETGSLSADRYGRLQVFNADFRELVPELVPWLRDFFALAFVDPYGPVMDMESLALLLGRRRTDGITLFPASNIALHGSSAKKPPAQLSAPDRGNITRTTAHFGTEEWLEIARNDTLAPDLKEAAYVDLYSRQLRNIDEDLLVKRIRLRFSKHLNAAYFLWLTTRNSHGAYRMTELLREAEVQEEWEVWRDREERARQAEGEQQGFFSELGVSLTPQPVPEPYAADPQLVIEDLLQRFGDGRRRTVKEVLEQMAVGDYVRTEVTAALQTLKRSGIAEYQNLASASLVIRPQTA